MISEQLKKEAQEFVTGVEDASYKDGYEAAVKEYSAKITALEAEYEKKIESAHKEGYDECLKALSGNNEGEPESGEGVYDSNTAKANLLALKGEQSYVVCVMDCFGKVYGTVKEWLEAGSPLVLGIAYTNGKDFLCMHINEIAKSKFGGDGVMFGKKVHTTTKQWKSENSTTLTAFDDRNGVLNTEGIIEGCNDSLAAKCKAVVFNNGKSGYMPASGELRLYCKYMSKVDALINDLGGDPLKTQHGAQMLHSSTCRNASTVWMVRYMKDGDAQPAFREKNTVCPTRAFVEL